MKLICPHHKETDDGYLKYSEKAEKGHKQRQCPDCLRWYFWGEFGKGWSKGIRAAANTVKQ